MERVASSDATQGRLPSGRHKLPKELVVQSQRERLLTAMLEAVAEKGYVATSVADVIGGAGVSRATFYELFADKEECFLEMYRTLTSQTISYVQRAFDGPDDWPAQAEAALAALLRFLSANDAVAKVALVDALAAGDRARLHYRESVRAFLPFVEAGRETAPPGAHLPASVALVVVGGIMHTVFEQVAAGRASSLPRLLPELVFTVMVPYVGPERALEAMENARRLDPEPPV